MMSCLSSPVLDMATVVHMLLVVVSSRSTTQCFIAVPPSSAGGRLNIKKLTVNNVYFLKGEQREIIFCLFDHAQLGDLGSECYRDLVEIHFYFVIFSIYGKIFLAYSPNTFKLFKRVLLHDTLKQICILTMSNDLKGTVYRKTLHGALHTGLERTTYKFYFSEILKNNLLYACIENTLNGEKNC